MEEGGHRRERHIINILTNHLQCVGGLVFSNIIGHSAGVLPAIPQSDSGYYQ